MKAAVVLSFVAAAVAGAIEPREGHCGGDNCARQVTGTRDGLTAITSRKNDCSNFMKTTVVPEATYVASPDPNTGPSLPPGMDESQANLVKQHRHRHRYC